VTQWLGLHDVDPSTWHVRQIVKDWWTEVIHKQGPSKKAMASLVMLISCLEGKECANIPGHLHDIKLHGHQNKRGGDIVEPC
jgi:hypothetical protein